MKAFWKKIGQAALKLGVWAVGHPDDAKKIIDGFKVIVK